MAALSVPVRALQMGVKAPTAAPARLSSNNIVKAPVRPAMLSSEFMGMTSLAQSLSGLSVSAVGPMKRLGDNRAPLEIVAGKRGGGMGANRVGSKKPRTKTSGYRARLSSKTGRNVLKARRKKGRKVLAPACKSQAK